LTGFLARQASADVPQMFAGQTARAAVALVAGRSTAGFVSAEALALAKGALQMLVQTQVRWVALAAAAVLVLGGLGGATYLAMAEDAPATQAETARDVSGIVLAVNVEKKTVSLMPGVNRMYTYTVTDKTVFKVDGKEAKLDDVKKDMVAQGKVVGRNELTSLDATTKDATK
jgi:hypothetical protein